MIKKHDEKIILSSARVPREPGPSVLPSLKPGAARGGGNSTQGDGVDEEGEAEGAEGEAVQLGRFTLFIDGISDLVGYPQIKSLFGKVGRVEKLFVQRNRKAGRRFRFGFAQFFSRVQAEAAVAKLNGTKSGGVHLSVTVARFP
ncbi:uncharacterized protein LOC130736569 [Lotus japonicus]|uniref:uncharacterized protein LOC130736569 n=1 Tax=Lotus japonicus TaxID=34305 RepID=UPI00258F31BD|nr:uncharacterized protein LOC130736569 [Lotus japonicus]